MAPPIVERDSSLWPTPVTTDAKSSARGTTTTGVMHAGESLTDAVRAETKHPGAILNPEWIEALMGFPAGWTDTPLDAATLDLFASRSPT